MLSTPSFTRDAILEEARGLPAAPQVMAGLSEILQDVNTNLDQIAEQIRMDGALAARVIRIGNSPVYGGGGDIGAVEEAVNRIGFREILRLVGLATVSGIVDRPLACYQITGTQLRESMLYHALAAEELAPFAQIDSNTAYSAGLLRGIGMMVVDKMGRARLGDGEYYDPAQFETYGLWESARFGLRSSDVATMILDEWRFPADVVTAVQEHLSVGESGEIDVFAGLLNLAGGIVARGKMALPGEAAAWVVTPEKLAVLGIDEEQFEAAAESAHETFQRHRAALY